MGGGERDMRSSEVHRTWDYTVGIVLMLAPFIFGFWNITNATAVAGVIGILLIGNAFLTNYGQDTTRTDYVQDVGRPISYNIHLAIDLVLGLFLAMSPWFYGFNRTTGNVWLPH